MSETIKTTASVPHKKTGLVAPNRPEHIENGSILRSNEFGTLQNIIGNRAVQRMGIKPTVSVRHRTNSGNVQRATGLAGSENLTGFSQTALDFCRESGNADKPLTDFADHLMTKINELLKEIPSHNCAHAFVTSGDTGAFASSSFSIKINTKAFSKRSGITKVSQLNQAEVAEIVDTIYHEARHSEQYYRLARTLAGEGKTASEIEQTAAVPNAVAAEAVKSPLADNQANTELITETNQWRDFIGRGKYVAYKGKIGNLRDAINAAREKLNKNDVAGFGTSFLTIGNLITAYFVPLINTINSTDPKTASDTLVLNDVQRIKDNYDLLNTEVTAPQTTMTKVKTAALNLHNARYQAYRNYPHEVDAWARGNEAGEKYKELDNAPKETESTTEETTTPVTDTTPKQETTTPVTDTAPKQETTPPTTGETTTPVTDTTSTTEESTAPVTDTPSTTQDAPPQPQNAWAGASPTGGLRRGGFTMGHSGPQQPPPQQMNQAPTNTGGTAPKEELSWKQKFLNKLPRFLRKK